MNGRQKANRLEQILDQHSAWERRTLADLHTAGFTFKTVEKAFQYRQAQRTLARMSHDDLIEAVSQINERKSA